MGFAIQFGAESTLIRLEGTIDIVSSADLKKAFLDAFENRKPIRLELDAVRDLDVTAVQLLWAVEREAGNMSVGFEIVSPLSDSVSASLRAAGFESVLVGRKS